MSKYARDLLYAQYERQSCEGAPRSVYLFHTEDYTNPDQPDDEVWPSFYYFQTAEYDPTDCGNSKLSAIDVCCFSSADITESAPYQSGGPQFVERTDISSYLPASANGARFCHLQSQDLGNALFGYKEAFYLADDSETCIDEYITCSSSGLLKVFPNASCQGTPDRVVLLQTTSPYETPLLGSVDGRLLFVTNATVRYAWTAWTPSDKMVPDFTLWQERLSLSMYILSGVICAAMLGYQTRRMFLDPASRRLWGYGTLLQFSVWIAYLIVCYGYWTIVFENTYGVAWYGEFTHAFFHFATFLTTTFTTATFVAVVTSLRGVWIYLLHFAIFVLHLLLGFPKYFYWFFNLTSNQYGKQYYGFVQLLKRWRPAYDYWLVFLFLYNIIPPLILSYLLVHMRSPRASIVSKVRMLLQIDIWVMLCLVGQLILLAGHLTIQYLNYYSFALGGDRQYTSTWGYVAFLMVLHSVLTFRIAFSIRNVADKMSASADLIDSAVTGQKTANTIQTHKSL